MKKNRQGKRNHYRRKKREEVDIHEKTYSNVLTRMIDKYEPDDEDWMGFKLSNNNAYTFHHIRERRAGGKEEMENDFVGKKTKKTAKKLKKKEKENKKMDKKIKKMLAKK